MQSSWSATRPSARGNPKDGCRPGGECIESSPAEKDLAVLVDGELSMSRQRSRGAQKASRMPGCVKSSVAGRSREVILPPYSALVRVEYCIRL